VGRCSLSVASCAYTCSSSSAGVGDERKSRVSRTRKKARKSGRREKNASRKRAVEPAAVTRAFRRTWRCVREITMLPFHPGADALALPAAAVQPRPAGEAREHVENVKCAGFRGPHAETSAFGSRASPSDRWKRSSSERRSEWRARWVPERPALTCGRVRRAARIAFARLDDAPKANVVVTFCLQKRPFLPARHERGGNVTRTAGDSTVRAWRAFRILQIAGFLRTRLQSDSRRSLNSVQPRFVARFVSKPPARMEKIRGVAISRIPGEPPNGTRRFRISCCATSETTRFWQKLALIFSQGAIFCGFGLFLQRRDSNSRNRSA
jgi:hypothetical protein